jgi:hypothetical protein
MENDTFKIIKLLEDAVYNHPQALLKLTNKNLLKIVNYMLPYSTGFEIECNSIHDSNKIKEVFSNIPNIMHVSGGDEEVRFRIPSKLNGLICLQEICNLLPDYFTLNEGSGIHYHIDMTDVFDSIDKEFIYKHNDYIINELIKWGTAKDTSSSSAACFLNSRGWVNFQSEFKTCEIRIGEMTFDYNVISKRIIDANRIVKYLKNQITPEAKLAELKLKLKSLNIKEDEINILKNYINVVNNRIIKI